MSETKVPLKVIDPKPEVKETVNPKTLKDTMHNYSWEVLGHSKCAYTKVAIAMLEAHGETIKAIQYIDTPDTAWKERLFSLGATYTPAIFRNSKLFGSLGELEIYYKRNFVPLQD